MLDTSCVVIARGGSKRIPNKNIRLFNGEPMVTWPVRSAITAQLFDTIYISTDSPEIERVATSVGASTLGLRPPELANDFSCSVEVLAYFLRQLQKKTLLPSFICCLYGTSVFVSPKMLQQGFTQVQQEGFDCVMAVTAYKHPIERALVRDEKGIFSYILPDNVNKRTQDCQLSYHDIGLFYWVNTDVFLKLPTPSFALLRKSAIIVPSSCAVDIDTEEDWDFAEHIAKYASCKV